MIYRRLVATLFLLAAVAVWPAQLEAQEDHSSHTAVGWVPREILQRPIGLREGIGKVNDVVTTSSQEARAFYNQGLAYLHSYLWIEAARSFNQALHHDAKLAMAYLGLSYTYSGLDDHAAAQQMFVKAKSLSPTATEREQYRIEMRGKQLTAMADPENVLLHLAYKKAIDAALAKWPDDSELWLLRGNAEEPRASGRGQRGGAASIAFYETAFKSVPDHFAAHHYLTHTYETIGYADRALKHGEAYARLAPAVPHAHHMYGHDLRRVGRIAEAIERFEKAKSLEEDYFKREGIRSDLDWHYAHNLSLLATAYQYEGRLSEAEKLFYQIFKLPKHMAYTELWTKEWPEFLLSRGRNQEALVAARTMTKSKWPSTRSVGYVLAGNALLALKRTKEAAAELVKAEAELRAVTPTGVLYISQGTIKPYLDALSGEMLLRSGQHEAGARLLKSVQAQIRAVPGPDAWIQALFRLESIARIAREAGDWELAEYTAKQMENHDAAYPGTLYALALVAEHNGDVAGARNQLTKAVELWNKADSDLPELRYAREKLK